LDKTEWEAFLEKLSELEKRYLQVLRELDEAHAKLNALEKSKQGGQQSPHEETARQEMPSRLEIEKKRGGILARFRAELGSIRAVSAQRKYATCSRCRHDITHVSRFCDRCGADFGGFVCSCGRGLSAEDRFCDRCGLPIEK